MKVRFTSITNATLLASRDNRRLTRFDVDFEATACSGKAFFLVMHSSQHVDMNVVRNEALGHKYDLAVSVDKVHEFREVPGNGPGEVVPLGPIAAFAFKGRMTEHLMTGEGCLFETGDVVLMIGLNMVPGDSLEVDEGTWVAFNAEGLTFWAPQ